MKINFQKEEATYKLLNAIKKSGPAGKSFIEGGVLFNQQVLMACGKIETKLLQLSNEDAEKFKSDNKDFFNGFAWAYYADWKKQKAKSCAHLLDVYNMLNIKLGLQDFIGETFYAGIPLTTAEEVNEAIQTCQVAQDSETPIGPDDPDFDHMKIGADGQLHKTDKHGEFEPWSDPADVYGDGSMVSTADLAAYNGEVEEEPEPWTDCYTCAHMGGDGKICETCKGWEIF